ncbi:uncharacterized protein Dana_GF22109 [Drosophila ananassae]|uniref:Uncharacterized protein n=1 Tax=Drosophila ananassae TaxID=7217 RepID=B3MYC1_DROAN|nr:uncharacterized protein LOC6504777 [Drosophila ananassae]EDV32615.2 uncharacterized protein Dana_GF22109 [Drosophila ananassae]
MCLLLSFGCCGCSSPKPTPKKKRSKQSKDNKPTEHYYSTDIQMQEFTRSEYQLTGDQMPNGSLASLPSMSPSLMALPHRIPTSTTLSSWACEEELYDMDEYEERTPTKWTAWWLQGASSSDQILAPHSSIFT